MPTGKGFLGYFLFSKKNPKTPLMGLRYSGYNKDHARGAARGTHIY